MGPCLVESDRTAESSQSTHSHPVYLGVVLGYHVALAGRDENGHAPSSRAGLPAVSSERQGGGGKQ